LTLSFEKKGETSSIPLLLGKLDKDLLECALAETVLDHHIVRFCLLQFLEHQRERFNAILGHVVLKTIGELLDQNGLMLEELTHEHGELSLAVSVYSNLEYVAGAEFLLQILIRAQTPFKKN
jgi:hypothetical protein